MARQQQIIETVICDLCGRQADDATTVTLGWGRDQWELDLCRADNNKVAKQFDAWIDQGRKVRRRGAARSARPARANTSDDWAYLESRGFKRHRGRKSAAEIAALAKRR